MYRLREEVKLACRVNTAFIGAVTGEVWCTDRQWLGDRLPLILHSEGECKKAAASCGAYGSWRDFYEPVAERPRTFWLVWCDNPNGGRVPTYRHYTEDSAKREAERLARLRSAERFWVMRAESACEVGSVEWVDADPEGGWPEDIPF